MFKEKIKNIFGIQKESEAFPYHKNNKNNFEKFHCIEGSSIEIEYLELIRSFIFATKPEQVLETGPYMGYSTIALASALKENGFGSLTSIEIDSNFIEKTRQNLIKFDPSLEVDLINLNSLDAIPNINKKFSFVLLDSGSNSKQLNLRIKELKILLDLNMLLEDCIIFIHDTSRFDERFIEFKKEINKITKKFSKIELDLSRGCTVIKYNKKLHI
jgi:predicted O-methyltransferase YrrM